MFDMLVNANKYPDLLFDDFIARQKLICKYDLAEVPGPNFEFKKLFAIERLEFLRYFYIYCRETNPLRFKARASQARKKKKDCWSKWLNSKNVLEELY
jgi:hypothetical protein